MKVIVTKKGSEMKSNKWDEGQEIDCHENIAKLFIERGIAVDPIAPNVATEVEEPTKKHKKK